MTLDYVGSRLDFVLIARATARHRLSFTNISGKTPVDVGTVTFTGIIEAEDGTTWPIECSHSGVVGELDMRFPALEPGRYKFEVASQCETGKNRLVFGTLGVMESVGDLMADVEPTEVKTLMVRIPEQALAQIQLEWRPWGALLGAAADVLQAAREMKQYAEILTNCAQKVEVMEARLAMLDGKLLSAVVPNTTTNTWWICGVDSLVQVTGDPGRSPQISSRQTWLLFDPFTGAWLDTGQRVQGEDGHSPHLSAAKTWVVWDKLTGQWEDTGLQAFGKNGINGTAVRRIKAPTVADIPTSGETCNGGFRYYVPLDGGGYDVYDWIEEQDGSASWERVGEANDLATSEIYGLVKTGMDAPVVDGAPVGTNRAGQLEVPVASPTVPGVSRPSCWEPLEDDASGAVGLTSDGRQRAEKATYFRFGSTKLSRSEVVPCGCVGETAGGGLGTTWASSTTGGSVLLSASGTITHGGLIGVNAAGQIVVREAGYMTYGCVCFGTEVRITLNNAPHVIAIAQCDGINTFNDWAGNMVNSLCVNLSQCGCLRYDSLGPNGTNTGNSLYLYMDDSLEVLPSGKLSVKKYVKENCIEKSDLDNYAKADEVMKKTEDLDGFVVVTKDELNALASRGAKTMYFVANKRSTQS